MKAAWVAPWWLCRGSDEEGLFPQWEGALGQPQARPRKRGQRKSLPQGDTTERAMDASQNMQGPAGTGKVALEE
eukprot:4403250-Amphidinium_carterae.1